MTHLPTQLNAFKTASGWAYEPSSGNGRKEEVDAAAAEQPEQNKEAAAVAAEGNGKL